jgi:YggT family protein
MYPFIRLISNIIDLYNMAIFVWFVLGMLVSFNIVNRTHPLVYRVNEFLTRLIDPVLRPIRKYLPPIGGIDISPIILILGLNFLQTALFYYFVR